jgi:hypothetical protein
MDEALRLIDVVDDAKGEVTKRVAEAAEYLASQDTLSANPQVGAIIKRTKERHHQAVTRTGSLYNDFAEFMREYVKEEQFYTACRQQVLARDNRVDARKIVHEELRDLLAQARQTMESTPEAIRTLVALASIAQSSQFLYYADLLNALLDYDPAYRRALDIAGKLAKAALMDLAGKVFPFTGTIAAAIDTIFDLVEPRIDKKIKELRLATGVYNRVADFGDQLVELLGYADFTEERIRHADQTLKTTHVSFATDTAWLIAVLGNAERDEDGIN